MVHAAYKGVGPGAFGVSRVSLLSLFSLILRCVLIEDPSCFLMVAARTGNEDPL